MTELLDHYDLAGKRALVVHDTPASDAIAHAYGEAQAQVTRVADESGVADAIAEIGGVDILASGPDVFLAKPIGDTDDTELLAVMAGNFTAHYSAVREASASMGTGGRIVLVTSVLGERGLPNCSAYAAAQGATHNLIRALAQELAPRGISINGIALGWMDWMDDRLDPTDEEASRAVRFSIAKRKGEGADIGPMAVWLSGTGAGFVTGQIFAADGGLLQHL
ncbi:MAG: SDR family oxidoreductase [Gammaproteobacteria bacterium]|nr:SDR family oxidoreductase [Gammaproteobacteria bacterium]